MNLIYSSKQALLSFGFIKDIHALLRPNQLFRSSSFPASNASLAIAHTKSLSLFGNGSPSRSLDHQSKGWWTDHQQAKYASLFCWSSSSCFQHSTSSMLGPLGFFIWFSLPVGTMKVAYRSCRCRVRAPSHTLSVQSVYRVSSGLPTTEARRQRRRGACNSNPSMNDQTHRKHSFSCDTRTVRNGLLSSLEC